MTRDRSRLLRESRNVAIPRSVAELGALGIPPSTLRGPHWRRTTRGCYVPAGAGEYDGSPTGLQRIIEAVPLLPPEGALTGWPAAYLAAVAGIDGLDSQSMAELPVPICLGRSTHRGDAHGVGYLCDRLPETERRPIRLRVHDVFLGQETVLTLPTTTPERAVFDGVRLAPDLSAAVAFLDMAANADWAALSAFEAYTSTRCGARRVRFVRQALELADSAARSPWESRLRVFYITVAPLPRPLVNVPIFNREGQLLGIADLFDEEAAQVTEFDGRAHRERRQHRADNDREEWFEDAGLVVVRADSLDLTRYATRLVERLHSARRRGLSRDRSKDKWTLDEPPSWLEERVDTSLSDAEKAELFTR